MDNTPNTESSAPQASPAWRWAGRFLRLIIMTLVIAGSVGISYYWLTNRPRTERRPPRPESVLVSVAPIEKKAEQVVVSAMGTAAPATEIQLAARVSGQIVAVNPQFTPGGYIEAGQVVLTIEPADYDLAVRQQEGNLVRAESEVQLEMGQQAVARREFELLMEDVDEGNLDLLLRKPQLASKEAAVATAAAALDKARLDLERTSVVAPFNAIVKTRNADMGAYVAPGAALAALIGTDVFWVEVTVPVDDLARIPLPDAAGVGGAMARVYHEAAWGAERYRQGRVVRLLPDLEPQGRLARLLVAVEDPMNYESDNDGAPPLLLGSFVRVAIEGQVLESVARIPRTAFHGGDTLWIMDADQQLEIRSAQPVWGTRDAIYIDEGVEDGDLLVISDLATPVTGMPLRTEAIQAERGGGAGRGAGGGGGRQGSQP